MYEVLWTRVLLSIFGATVYASGTVLTSFMFGLALGSWLAARFGDLLKSSPLRVYGFLELAIGIYALLFPFILQGINSTYTAAFGQYSGSLYVLSLIRFMLAFLALFIPATLMGATLPVITRHAVTGLSSLGKELGRLYAVNTIGAACGTFVTGYIFIEWMGIRNTTLVAVILNVLVFVGALLLAHLLETRGDREVTSVNATIAENHSPKRKDPKRKDQAKKQRKQDRDKSHKMSPAKPRAALVHTFIDRNVIVLVLAISGCCALAYEVLWARILVYILGNFVHSFSVMLAAFLTGIALGSYILGRTCDRLRRPWVWLAGCQAVIGLSALLLFPVFGQLLVFRDAFLESLSTSSSLADYRDPWWEFTAWKVGVTFLLMLVPTFCMGASFPLANRLYIQTMNRVSRGVGLLYAGNTLGGIVGAFLASFVLIPWLGIRDSVLVMVILNLGGAALLVARREGRWQIKPTVLAGGSVAVVALFAVLTVPATIFFPIYASAESGKRLTYVRETVAGTVTIHETPNGFRVIDINGLNVAGTKFGFLCTQKLQAHFPLLMHPDPRRIMQIGFGTGGTCFSVSLHQEVQNIDCVEINPGVIAAAPHFEEINHGIYRPGEEPRVKVIIEDARNFVAATQNKYDVILSDSIHPRFTGNGLLYTKDYYELCAEVMHEDGVLSTWLPTAYLGPQEYKAIIRTIQSVFPHVLIWYMNNTVEGYTIVMGSRTEWKIDFDQLAERISRPALAADLKAVHLENIYDFLDCIAMGGTQVEKYLGAGLLNTEDRPIIEFRAPRNMNRIVTEYKNLEEIIEYRNFPEEIMKDWATDPDLANCRRDSLLTYFHATTLVLHAHQAHLIRRLQQELELYQRALAINPNDRDAAYLIRRLEQVRQGGKLDW